MPLCPLSFGIVKFFNPKEHWGFISPLEPREDGQDVYFKFDNCQSFKDYFGFDVEFNGETPAPLPHNPNKFCTTHFANAPLPEIGDRVVYDEYVPVSGKHAGKPRALNWSYTGYWQHAVNTIVDRKDPYDTLHRVVHFPDEKLPEVIWVGSGKEFEELFKQDSLPLWLLEWSTRHELQELLIEGWRYAQSKGLTALLNTQLVTG